jgi:hypothetical protein
LKVLHIGELRLDRPHARIAARSRYDRHNPQEFMPPANDCHVRTRGFAWLIVDPLS